MRVLATLFLILTVPVSSFAQDTKENAAVPSTTSTPTEIAIRAVSPALDRYLRETVDGNLWTRPELSPRDRSIVTLAVLISLDQPAELPSQMRRALDNGVTPAEMSEVITHLAFYSGIGNASAAALVAKDVFAERGIGPDQLPAASPELLPIDEVAEEKRATTVATNVGPISPGLVTFTGDLLFKDLWLRPGLQPRDRSLVTVASLIASGHVAQMPFHLNKAMDNGLTKEQAGEVITQVAFYAGWPNAFSAVPVAAEVFRSRGH